MRVFSFGGGVQSTAALVLAARGVIDYPVFLFANVGDDSENPDTMTYMAQHAVPYAQANGIELHSLDRTRRDGAIETLLERVATENTPSIPVRLGSGMPANRACTKHFKVMVISKWLKAHGATPKDPATVGVGISVDEIERANTRTAQPVQRIEYPLLTLGLRRPDCYRIIQDAGLPEPPKSSCWFCPFRSPQSWLDMRAGNPVLFERAADLEDSINYRRAARGKDSVFFTRFGAPLRLAIPDGVMTLPFADDDGGTCDSNWCMT